MKSLAYKNKIILYFFAVFVLLSPTILRLNTKTIGGSIPYYYLQKFGLNPAAYKILPFLFAAGIIFLFYLNMRSMRLKQDYIYISIFLLMFSIPFIYICTYFTEHSILLFLILLGFYLFQKKKPIFHILGSIVFLSTAIFGVFAVLIPIFLLAYSFTLKKKKNYAIIVSGIILVYLFYNWFYLGKVSPTFLVDQPILRNFILEFGAHIGLGITMFILAFFGFLLTWKYKFKLIYIYLATIILFALSARYLFFIVYLNIFIVFFAAHASRELVEKKWDLKFIGLLAIIALICSFLFSAVSFADREAEAPPTLEMLRSFESLAREPGGIVLTLPEYSFWIEYYTNTEPFSTPFAPEDEILDIIFQSRNLKQTSELLSQHHIKYIWIDDSMKTGKIWSSRDQGLLHLLPSKIHFKNNYNKNHIEIWEFISD
ncbi:MAG: hypothetical protein KAT43_00680 [Nanoarchaeota archaeon]|nr:hypothetical protein [Nanoarchaeota archaeon]